MLYKLVMILLFLAAAVLFTLANVAENPETRSLCWYLALGMLAFLTGVMLLKERHDSKGQKNREEISAPEKDEKEIVTRD